MKVLKKLVNFPVFQTYFGGVSRGPILAEFPGVEVDVPAGHVGGVGHGLELDLFRTI